MRNQTVHGRFEIKGTEGPRPQFPNQYHQQLPFQHPLQRQTPDRRSPSPLPSNQPTPTLHFPTPSFSATIKSDALRNHFDLPPSQHVSDFDINGGNRPAGTPPTSKGHYPSYFSTTLDKNDTISPSTPHSLSPMPFFGSFDMSLPPRKLHNPCHGKLRTIMLNRVLSSQSFSRL